MSFRSGRSSPSREPIAREIRARVKGAVAEVTVWYMEVARVEIRVPVSNHEIRLLLATSRIGSFRTCPRSS